MKKLTLLLMATMVLATMSCNDTKKKDTEMDADTTEETMTETNDSMDQKMSNDKKEVSFMLEAKSESNASGKVMFQQVNGKVTMEASLSGLEPGTHAIHIHEKADCTAGDGTSAGGHWNPTFQPHGKWGASEGYHKGDIGNFEADDNGNGRITMTTDQWCIGCGDSNRDVLGKSIIVHQGADDFTSQPSGAAGARVSCGGIIQ
ncbi:superoxide dismutase family protein [Altibacter sp. HG106]|uniref:superoxide dismutase family protein n=1 Tax=Altibacter sp. HG106 TaxID=3023937 RepID=UPI002351036A|nr:superoxide dismutase family protein [Altibacter sp. HG106]MDC7993811.1 superoxide dismutase family protein [Altibacter sp. HG106]